MVLKNPGSTYRALLLDYDALLEASNDECCYSLSEREVQIMLAFVDYVGWKTRYIATDTEIDSVTIRHWSGNLARKLMSGCCPDNDLHRFSEGGIYQSSNDGGETWINDPEDDPRNDYVGLPPLPGGPSDATRCAGADNVRGLFEQYRDNLIEIVGTTPTILYIVSGIVAFIAVLAGISGVGVGISVLFLTMAAQMITIGGTGISGAITFTALDDFKCLVYCHMNESGELTYSEWQLLLVDIAAHYSGFAETFFYQTVNGMGYIGMNNAATMGESEADDCGTCGCENCSNLDAWDIVYGTTITKTPGYWKLSSVAVGPNQAVRLARTVTPNCCSVTYNITSGVVQNQAWYRCSDDVVVFSPPTAGDCMYDVGQTNIFNIPFEVEFFFEECP